MKQYVIGLDIGTSGCKAALVDEKVNVVATSRQTYAEGSAVVLHPGWVDQDPIAWWNAVKAGIREIVKYASDGEIKAIGFSAQMHGLVALDAEGELLRPCITCNDGRTVPQCDEIYDMLGGPVEGRAKLLAATNNYMFPSFTATKILWVKENEPEIFEKMAVALNPKDYIRYLLTGAVNTDASDACGFGIFDCRNNCWSSEIVDAIGIPLRILPPVVESDDVVGKVLPEVAAELGLSTDVEVTAGGGDAVTQTTGCGAVTPGVYTITLGTGAVIGSTFSGFKPNPAGTSQMFRSNSAGLCMAFGGTGSGCGALTWLEQTMFAYEKQQADAAGESIYNVMSAMADSVPAGCSGLMFYPQMVGQRCPYEDADTRGGFVGLRPFHGRAHFARALMEGIALCLLDNVDVIDCMCGEVKELSITGGGAASDVWCQIFADVFGKKVVRYDGFAHGGAIGGALTAGCGAGIWKDYVDAVSNFAVDKEFLPNAENHTKYAEMLKTYKQFYPRFKDMFQEMKNF